mgnify:CR=1 FL=1
MAQNKQTQKIKNVLDGFKVAEIFLPTKPRHMTKKVLASYTQSEKQGKRSHVILTAQALAQAGLAIGDRVALALLHNGSWALVKDAAGGLIGPVGKQGHARVNVFAVTQWKEEAEFQRGLWVFPPDTFRRPTPPANS